MSAKTLPTHRAAKMAGLTALLGLACEGGAMEPASATPTPIEQDLSFVDRAPLAPTGRAYEKPKLGAEGDAGPKAEDCGTRTGKKSDGSCEFLAVKDMGYVQRVLLPAGRFVMGRVPPSYDAGPGRQRQELMFPGAPPRYATAASVWMDLHEVSRKTYQDCVDAGTCTPAKCADGGTGLPPQHEYDERLISRLPQTCVTHAQASSFCAAHEGRLPTAVEWEYAARGVDGRRQPWGNAVRDEIGAQLMPVGLRLDESYFFLLGLGSSGSEWVADAYAVDMSLAGYLAGDFRSPQGPLARSLADWEGAQLCAAGKPGCSLSEGARSRHVAKGPTPSHMRAVYDEVPAGFTASTSAEGWKGPSADAGLGFRCAANLSAEDPHYLVPASPPQLPLISQAEGLEIFGSAVAEVVNQAEAQRFCEQLRNPGEGDEIRSGWRLPTLQELQSISGNWRGPGPFWLQDGAAVQVELAWQKIDAPATDALLARCVRG